MPSLMATSLRWRTHSARTNVFWLTHPLLHHTWSSFLVLTYCQCYGTNAHLLTLQDSHANNTKNNKIEHTITSLRSVSVHMPTTQINNKSFRPYCVVTVFACKCACVFNPLRRDQTLGQFFSVGQLEHLFHSGTCVIQLISNLICNNSVLFLGLQFHSCHQFSGVLLVVIAGAGRS